MNKSVRSQTDETVVIVDDDPTSLHLFYTLCIEAVKNIKLFSEAEAALDFISENKCTVLITDFALPCMSGIELLTRIREIQPTIPVIVTSKYDTQALVLTAWKYGAFEFLEKPIDTNRFLSSLALALNFGTDYSSQKSGQPLIRRHKLARQVGTLDTQSMMDQLSNDRESIMDVYETFLQFSQSSLKLMRQFLREKKIDEVVEIGKTLLGTMTSMYAYDAETLMEQIVSIAKSEQSLTEADFKMMSNEFERIKDAIEVFAKKKPV